MHSVRIEHNYIDACLLEMDSWRTDRHLDYYSAANVEKLQRVLRTFIVYDTEMGEREVTVHHMLCNAVVPRQ